MLLITAPSKTQLAMSRFFPSFTLPVFLKKSNTLIEFLRGYTAEELCSLMNMSEALGQSTRQRISDFQLPLTLENSRQALFTFQGDAYSSLNPEFYNEKQLLHAQEHIRILSGLYGILRPLDLMFPYRLEMGTRLASRKWKNLYDFWGNDITEKINDDCSRHRDNTVVNLASAEYAKVINRKILVPQFITVTFQERKEGSYKTIPIYSKRARGMMLHYVISNQLTEPQQLLEFSLEGYTFAKERSTADNWIFTRG